MHKLNNTTPVPNALLDVSMKTLKPVELKVLLVIIRQTIGWRKSSDWISSRQFCEKTGCSRRAVTDAVQSLVESGWIQMVERNRRRFFQLADGQNLPEKCAKFAPKPAQVLPPTREKQTKETCTRSKNCSSEKLRQIKLQMQGMGIVR